MDITEEDTIELTEAQQEVYDEWWKGDSRDCAYMREFTVALWEAAALAEREAIEAFAHEHCGD